MQPCVRAKVLIVVLLTVIAATAGWQWVQHRIMGEALSPDTSCARVLGNLSISLPAGATSAECTNLSLLEIDTWVSFRTGTEEVPGWLDGTFPTVRGGQGGGTPGASASPVQPAPVGRASELLSPGLGEFSDPDGPDRAWTFPSGPRYSHVEPAGRMTDIAWRVLIADGGNGQSTVYLHAED